MKRNRGKQWNGKDRDLFKKIRDTKGTKEPLDEREKVGIKLNIQKTKIMASSPITSWQIDGKQWKQWQTLFFQAPKSLQIVTVPMKLKDDYRLEGKF